MVMVMGLGLFASAQTWEGTWDTDIVIVPAAGTFADFISSFDSDLDVNFLVGGWDFGMTSDFSQIGMDGLGFTAEGVLGAFSFDVDMDFVPMQVTAVATAYTGLQTASSACLQTDSWTYTTKTVTKTYMPAFQDITVEGSVSIAGLNFGGLFFLKGTDADHAVVYTTWDWTTKPTQFSLTGTTTVPTSTTVTVAGTTKVGTGAKFTISGSFGGATVTSYTYFNLSEYMYNTIAGLYGTPHIADALQKYGTITGLVCEGCSVSFSEEYILVEGLAPFGGCLELDMAARFTCCDFDYVKFLFKDITLGAWGLDFDFLVTFTPTAKSMAFEPEITIAGACFTVSTELLYTDETIEGLQIEGLSYSQTFNGLTLSFAASWDYSDNPLIGSYSTITHYGASKVYFWKPDTHRAATDTDAAVNDSGVGNYVLDYAYCSYEKATVFNKLSIDYEADACCGGLFTFSSDTYFGSLASYTLTGIFGTYLFDSDATAGWDVNYDFLGTGGYFAGDNTAVLADYDEFAADTEEDCDPCYVEGTYEENLLIDKDYSSTAIHSIFGWVESDIDVSIGVASNVTIDLGVDMAWWGWENISFGVTFEW